MTSRDLVIRTLNHEPVDRVPRDLWCSPEVEISRADELAEINIRYPKDIVAAEFKYPAGERCEGKPHRVGLYTDAWGCTWHVPQRGAIGQLRRPPLADQSKIAEYRPPFELLTGAKLGRVNRSCQTTSRFVLAWTETRPFQRLQLLRGTEAACADLAAGTAEIRSLLAMLHDFFCQEMEMWAETEVDGVEFMDQLASQDLLLIDPEIWRNLFKPLYRDYCDILHAKDKFAFFHSTGNISDIFGDLVRTGVDAINLQLSVTDVERLAKRFRGRVTFWGGIDRQHILPGGTRDQIAEAVCRVRKALDFGTGGVIAQYRWEPNVPLQNVVAVFEQWMLPLPVHV